MAQCACGNQDLEYKTGVSKKTGKKWQGWKCLPCDLMMGMDGTPWGQKKAPTNFQPQAPQTNQQTTQTPSWAKEILTKIDRVLYLVGDDSKPTQEKIHPIDETAEETPF